MHQINLIRRELRQYFPWHGARLTFLALFLVALFRARTVNLVEIASVFANCRAIETNSKRIYRFFSHYTFSTSMVTQGLVKMFQIPQPWTLSLVLFYQSRQKRDRNCVGKHSLIENLFAY